MASTANTSTKAALDAIADACDAGSANASAVVRVYSGTVPTDCDTALSGNTLLAELVMSNPAFGAAADSNPGATVTASAISDDTAADATGTATFIRILDRDRVAKVQITVASGQVTFNTTSLVANALVKITALTLFMPD